MNLLTIPFRTTLGAKYAMALTGLGLIGFVLAHMAGNLLIFAGRDALNGYSEALHAKPSFLWSARAGLLFIFLLHLVLAFRLWELNRSARPVRYIYEDTVEATWASRHMMLTGLVLLVFIIFHLAHFTFGVVDPAHFESGNVYANDIHAFSNPFLSLAYVIAQIFLCLHLCHGGSSWFQSLGLNHPQYNTVIRGVGPVIAVVVLVGNCSIPLAVLFGVVRL
jgi:succinate dehydrogenase / fumarate reductase cytochrome b subunit